MAPMRPVPRNLRWTSYAIDEALSSDAVPSSSAEEYSRRFSEKCQQRRPCTEIYSINAARRSLSLSNVSLGQRDILRVYVGTEGGFSSQFVHRRYRLANETLPYNDQSADENNDDDQADVDRFETSDISSLNYAIYLSVYDGHMCSLSSRPQVVSYGDALSLRCQITMNGYWKPTLFFRNEYDGHEYEAETTDCSTPLRPSRYCSVLTVEAEATVLAFACHVRFPPDAVFVPTLATYTGAQRPHHNHHSPVCHFDRLYVPTIPSEVSFLCDEMPCEETVDVGQVVTCRAEAYPQPNVLLSVIIVESRPQQETVEEEDEKDDWIDMKEDDYEVDDDEGNQSQNNNSHGERMEVDLDLSRFLQPEQPRRSFHPPIIEDPDPPKVYFDWPKRLDFAEERQSHMRACRGRKNETSPSNRKRKTSRSRSPRRKPTANSEPCDGPQWMCVKLSCRVLNSIRYITCEKCHTHRFLHRISPPCSWSEPLEKVTTIKLDGRTREYRDIIKLLGGQSVPSIGGWSAKVTEHNEPIKNRIIAICRIQNLELFQSYILRRDQVVIKNKSTMVEHFLIHGTSSYAADNIGKTGFNKGYAGQNSTRLGLGNYFTILPNYACDATYARIDDKDRQHILLAAVITGTFCKGEPSMNEAPEIPGSGGLRYDTVVEDTSAPTMYCSFSDTSAYPLYHITLKKL